MENPTPLEDMKMPDLLALAASLGATLPRVGIKKETVMEAIRELQAASPASGDSDSPADATLAAGILPMHISFTPPASAPPRPCRYCEGTGRHSEYGRCPYCVGSGLEDVDEPQPERPPAVVGPMAGRTLTGMNLFELRGVAKAFGIPGYSGMAVGEIFREIQGNRPDDIQVAINIAYPEQPEGTWTAVRLDDGSVLATDPEGWWRALVQPDGAASITKFEAPNLHNRVTATSEGDVTMTVPSLEGLICLLDDLGEVAKALLPQYR